MDYTNIITREDITTKLTKRGYNLFNILDTTHFATTEDAVDDFIQTCFDSQNELIATYRGDKWTKGFLEDMSINSMQQASEVQQEFNEAYIKALIEHCIYTYDNGDAQASALKDNPNNEYGAKQVSILWNKHILR